MNSIKEVSDLRVGIYDLMNLFNKNEIKLQKQANIILNLEQQLKEKEDIIYKIKSELESVKVAKSLISGIGDDASEAKQKITNLVREIDKCIAMLNE